MFLIFLLLCCFLSVGALHTPQDWMPGTLDLRDGDFALLLEEIQNSEKLDALQKFEDEQSGLEENTPTNVMVVNSKPTPTSDSTEEMHSRPVWAESVFPSFIQRASFLNKIFGFKDKKKPKPPPYVEVVVKSKPFDAKAAIRERSIIRTVAEEDYIPIPKSLDELNRIAALYKDDYQRIPGVRLDCEGELKLIEAGADKFWIDADCEEHCEKYKDCDMYARDGYGEASWLCSGINWMSNMKPSFGWQVGIRPDLFLPFDENMNDFVVLRNHQVVCPGTVLSADYSATKYFEQLVKECSELTHPSGRACQAISMRFAASPVGDPRDATRLIPHHVMCASGEENGLRYMEGHAAAIRVVKEKKTAKSPWKPRERKENKLDGLKEVVSFEPNGMVGDQDGVVYNPHAAQLNALLKQNKRENSDLKEAKQQAEKMSSAVDSAVLMISTFLPEIENSQKKVKEMKVEER